MASANMSFEDIFNGINFEIAKSIDLDYVNNSGNLTDSILPRLASQHELDIEKHFQLIVGFKISYNQLTQLMSR